MFVTYLRLDHGPVDPKVPGNLKVEGAYHRQREYVQKDEVDGVVNFRIVKFSVSEADDFNLFIFQLVFDCFEEDQLREAVDGTADPHNR